MLSGTSCIGKVETAGRFINPPPLRAHLYGLIVLCGELLAAGELTAARYIGLVGGLLGTLQTLRAGEGVAHVA